MARWLLTVGLALLSLTTYAQELEDYLKVRQQHKVRTLTPIAGLEIAVGKRVLEVEGVTRGSVSVGESQSVLLEIEPMRSLIVNIPSGYGWLTRGQVRVRALVRVERESDLVTPTYTLLSAVHATVFHKWEAQERERLARAEASRQQAKAKSAPPRGTTSSRGTTNARSNTGRPPIPTINDWQTYAQNLHLYYPYYYNAIRHFNPRLSHEMADTIAWSILRFSAHYGVDPRLIMAIVLVESGFNPNATSRKGAAGLGQLMPGTARGLGVADPYDPVQNLAGTVRLVRGHLENYLRKTGNPDSWEHLILALAAYNAGSGAVRKHGGVPPYRETQNYVKRVVQLYKQFCGIQD
ncbi:MAG: lytic transglycosylase domain-containing protein [Fimbriimonadales bacterium]